jgi:hypothetical protein
VGRKSSNKQNIGDNIFLVASMGPHFAIHTLKHGTLATTAHEIISTNWPFRKPRHIPVKDIVKVKISENSSLRPGVVIWYDHKDEIRKERIVIQYIKQKDRTEFFKYLENFVESKISSTGN